MNTEPLIIAITGGIGAGKSALSACFAEMGYPIIITDLLAKNILATDTDIQQRIISEFGSDAFVDGKYNTEFIASKVFPDAERLQKLNQILHPAVIDAMIEQVETLQDSEQHSIIFVESALIFELELEDGFDYVISVSASEQVRIKRIAERSGLSKDEIKQRMSSQLSQEEKNRMADFVVQNETTLLELASAAEYLLPILQSLPNRVEQKKEDE
ncbi:MAG: dephospho-CoA kinase [Ignavibacteria bacterium]|jgi:dephospho-CoA kinase|nr:dephospho-CoA kinase [Ignavibacteria bacterium]